MTAPFDFTRAIVRAPGASVVSGLRAGGGPDPSFAGVCAEHAAYVAALEAAGLAITTLEPLEAFPDAIFLEDPALVFPEAAILLKPGAPSRQGEVGLLRPVAESLFPQVIALPEGHADGGDVLDTGRELLIGLSARTDRAGAAALVRVLASLGRAARVVETPPGVLHLKTACTMIAPDTLLATAELATSELFGDLEIVTVPAGEEAGANVLRINDRILAGAGFPRLFELLARYDAAVVPLQNKQIALIDAGFTCMSLRW